MRWFWRRPRRRRERLYSTEELLDMLGEETRLAYEIIQKARKEPRDGVG